MAPIPRGYGDCGRREEPSQRRVECRTSGDFPPHTASPSREDPVGARPSPSGPRRHPGVGPPQASLARPAGSSPCAQGNLIGKSQTTQNPTPLCHGHCLEMLEENPSPGEGPGGTGPGGRKLLKGRCSRMGRGRTFDFHYTNQTAPQHPGKAPRPGPWPAPPHGGRGPAPPGPAGPGPRPLALRRRRRPSGGPGPQEALLRPLQRPQWGRGGGGPEQAGGLPGGLEAVDPGPLGSGLGPGLAGPRLGAPSRRSPMGRGARGRRR